MRLCAVPYMTWTTATLNSGNLETGKPAEPEAQAVRTHLSSAAQSLLLPGVCYASQLKDQGTEVSL